MSRQPSSSAHHRPSAPGSAQSTQIACQRSPMAAGLPNVCAGYVRICGLFVHRRRDLAVGCPPWRRDGRTWSSTRWARGGSRPRSASRGSWPSRRRAGSWRPSRCGPWSGCSATRSRRSAPSPRCSPGVVQGGPVEVDVQVLRRGRSMSQLTATVRNPGADAGPHRDRGVRRAAARVRVHRARDARRRRSRRPPRLPRPAPRGRRLRVRRRPVPVLGARSSSAGRRSAGRRGSRSRTGPPRRRYWYRLDHPPLAADGSLDVAGADRDVRHDARLRSARSSARRPSDWFAPSVDFTLHVLRLRRARAGSSPTSAPATPATATPASTCALWDPAAPTAPPSSPTPPS